MASTVNDAFHFNPDFRCPYLEAIYESLTVDGPTGPLPLAGNIPREYAWALHQCVLANQPTTIVEVGMGYGIATLAMLSALRKLGGQRTLITIDPLQERHFCGVRAANVQRAQDWGTSIASSRILITSCCPN